MSKFKIYNQKQGMFLPLDLKDCLPKDHIAFMISDVVDNLDVSAIEKTYSDVGAPGYYPKMMLKVLFYGYTQGVRSSRKIEAKLYEDTAYRFLSANEQPDHGTISLFRKEHLEKLEEIFAQIVILCNGLGMVKLGDISIDGTKIKASAGNSMLYMKERIRKVKEKIREILTEAERIDKEEDKTYGKKRGYNEIPQKLIDPKTRQKEINKLKQKLLKIEKAEEIINQKQSEASNQKERELTRNKTSNTTDPDANLMKMKDGSYKMAYNVQLATSNQVILSYDVNTNAADTDSLPTMIEKTENITEHKVEEVKADAGYFSKENIESCNGKEINAYIPDPLKSMEEKEERENCIPRYDRRNFKYDSKKDEFICPEGRRLIYKNADKGAKRYIGTDCQNCPAKSQCTKGESRIYKYDFELEKLTTEMRIKLNSPQGKSKYLERLSEIEPVFGNLKLNQGFNYFLCRGKPMVLIETGLQSISHNFVKIFNWLKRTKKSISDYINMYGKGVKLATTQ